MSNLQSVIVGISRASVNNVETQRLCAISNIKNALEDGGIIQEHVQRLDRLLLVLEASSRETPQRKFAILHEVVSPVLLSTGLVNEL